MCRGKIGCAHDHPRIVLITVHRSDAASAALTVLRSAGTNPILRSFPQGAIIVFDADLRYLSAGGLGLAEVGLSRAILEGHTIFEVFPPATVAIIEPLYRRALAGHESSIDVPYEGRIFLQRLGPLYDADGGIVAGMGFTQDVTAVRDAERRLTDAESIGGVGSWEVDLVTEAVTWSAGLFELYGLNQDQFDGNYTAALKCIHPGDRARVNTAVEACARTGEPLRDRYRITRGGDDALRWIETRGEAQYDNGVRVRITGAIADVTDQVDAAAAAAAAQSFQHAVFTASPDIISVWDFPSGSVLWSNCSIPARLGYTGEDAAAMGASPARFLVVADDLKQYEAGLAAARDATDDQVLQSDFRMARKDGTIRWFSRLSAPLQRDENRRVTRIVGITRDTTDERTVQAALVESQNRFHQLADTVTVSFILRSLDPPAFLYISPGFAKIFGFDPMSVSKRPGEGVRRIVHPDDYEWAMEQYWEKAAAGVAAQAEPSSVSCVLTARSGGSARAAHRSSTSTASFGARLRPVRTSLIARVLKRRSSRPTSWPRRTRSRTGCCRG